ncbi:MAG TPA: (d)CMP kinase [Terriglobales bacterium]|nr:(d)CMP kinase [Terriglobales bacterium]
MNASGKKLIIAIDGPAGAGKSTIASRLARKLGYLNLETGAMYRALALKAIETDSSFDEEDALLELARSSRIELEPKLDGNRVLLDGMDVSARVREADVSQGASRVSVHPAVREWMVERQRELGAGGGVVMEGRDVGTKIFPDADVKIFLDAAPHVRVARRLNQEQGATASALAAEISERDKRDRLRAASPLVPAADAVVLDTSNMSVGDVVGCIEEIISSTSQALPRRSTDGN